jgi:hypothetical protein
VGNKDFRMLGNLSLRNWRVEQRGVIEELERISENSMKKKKCWYQLVIILSHVGFEKVKKCLKRRTSSSVPRSARG